MIWRSEASDLKVHGQFGGGYVKYTDINIPPIDHLYLQLRYSKYSPSSVPILVYIDDEQTPRASFYPINQGSWNGFAWSEQIPLGNIQSGVHSIKFYADGQQYGVADLDKFILAAGSTSTEKSPTPTPTPTSVSSSTPWTYERECEYPDESTVGQLISRSNASGSKVHGQFGTTADSPWPAAFGEVKYTNINIPAIDNLYLKLRYSKNSSPSVPILVYVDDEQTPRATFYPADQGSWDRFVWTEPIPLGSIGSGIHSIKFSTDGQQYGVADLDEFVLTAELPPVVTAPVSVMPTADQDLLVWYDFEGDFLTSGIIADRSGNGHDAQINGTVDVAKGISAGQAIFFSGNGYIQAQSNPVAGRNTVSFSLWFKADHPGNNYKLVSAAWMR